MRVERSWFQSWLGGNINAYSVLRTVTNPSSQNAGHPFQKNWNPGVVILQYTRSDTELNTEPKDLCLSAKFKVDSSLLGLPLYPTLLCNNKVKSVLCNDKEATSHWCIVSTWDNYCVHNVFQVRILWNKSTQSSKRIDISNTFWRYQISCHKYRYLGGVARVQWSEH